MKAIVAIALAALPMPALAQSMDHPMDYAGHAMPGMDMPGMEQGNPMPANPTGQAAAAEPTGTDQTPGSAEPPPVARDRLADRYWDPAEMAAAAEAEMHPPEPVYAKVLFDIAEYQVRDGKDGYRWEGAAWLGDLNRFVIKARGEGTFRDGLDQGEVQALYSRALDPWWNLQAGIRQDIRPRPVRTWATLGIEGRAPYQFEVQAAAFLSDKGQLTGRFEAAYDQRITQRLILQPRAEFNFSARDMPDQRIGSGLSTVEAGLRLRYELRREFAPYVGINWTWAAGRTADFTRADGKDTHERSLVAGLRFWF